MKLLLSWKIFDLDPTKGVDENGSIAIRYTFGGLVLLFSVRDGFCVVSYDYLSKFYNFNNSLIDSEFNDKGVTYYNDLESAIAEYERCVAVITSSLFGNSVRPIIVTDEDRKNIDSILSGNEDTCKDDYRSFLLGTYEKDNSISFILYVCEDTVLYDSIKFNENSVLMSGALDFDCIPLAVDVSNENLMDIYDFDDDCFDKDEILNKAKEYKLI